MKLLALEYSNQGIFVFLTFDKEMKCSEFAKPSTIWAFRNCVEARERAIEWLASNNVEMTMNQIREIGAHRGEEVA